MEDGTAPRAERNQQYSRRNFRGIGGWGNRISAEERAKMDGTGLSDEVRLHKVGARHRGIGGWGNRVI